MGLVWKFGIIAFLLSGCSYTIQKHPLPSVPSPANYNSSALTFSSVYSQVLKPSCVSCHGSSGGINLESYDSVRANLALIYQVAIVERKMPKSPTPALTADQLGLLNAWILAGAPESSGPNDPKPSPSLAPTFDSLKANIFEPICMGCHAPGKPIARIPLVTRNDFLNSPLDIVIPGDADDSDLILTVTGQMPNKFMPPPKDESGQATGFSALNDDEIKAIRDWINNGAKD